jgi:hypothetical protein
MFPGREPMVGVLLAQQFQKDDDQEGYRGDAYERLHERAHIELQSTT